MNIEDLNIDLIKSYGKTLEYKSCEIIFNEGDSCDKLGLVLEGEAKIITYTYQDKEEIINNVKKGDLFGQFVLFSKHSNYVAS